MEQDFIERINFDSDILAQAKEDMNFVLQRLIGNMVEKGSYEGSMTVKIDVTIDSEYIPNYDPDIKGESRECRKPKFKHKVTSVVKINDEKSGNTDTEMELVMDEETGLWVVRPIMDTAQRSFYDADFREVYDPEDEAGEHVFMPQGIEGRDQAALPGPTEPEDISDELFDDDGYGYEEAEE